MWITWAVINLGCKTLRKAQAFCQGLSGDLAKVNSAKELEFLFNLLRKQAPTVNWTVWIALSWNSTANDFYWTDHTPLIYKHWASGEPNGNAGEPCGQLFTNTSYDWNDIGCDLHINGWHCLGLIHTITTTDCRVVCRMLSTQPSKAYPDFHNWVYLKLFNQVLLHALRLSTTQDILLVTRQG